jgi:ribosomal-protein-alanine N-acetyltransferase
MGWFFKRKPELVVDRSTPADIGAMADIHARSFSKPWHEDEIARLLSGKGVAAFVVRTHGSGEGPPCGFVIVREVAGEAEIITIATDPSKRRLGIGRALMNHAIRQMHGDRVARLFLEVSEDNQTALPLYRSLGFRQVGVRKGYYASGAPKPTSGSTGPGAPPSAPSALVMELDLR